MWRRHVKLWHLCDVGVSVNFSIVSCFASVNAVVSFVESINDSTPHVRLLDIIECINCINDDVRVIAFHFCCIVCIWRTTQFIQQRSRMLWSSCFSFSLCHACKMWNAFENCTLTLRLTSWQIPELIFLKSMAALLFPFSNISTLGWMIRLKHMVEFRNRSTTLPCFSGRLILGSVTKLVLTDERSTVDNHTSSLLDRK